MDALADGTHNQDSGHLRKTPDLLICMTAQVDQKNESILVPIYGLMVPFHILAVKNAVNSQEGDHSYIRINFNFGPTYEPGAKFPQSIFLKELSYRTSDNRHAAKVCPLCLLPLREPLKRPGLLSYALLCAHAPQKAHIFVLIVCRTFLLRCLMSVACGTGNDGAGVVTGMS